MTAWQTFLIALLATIPAIVTSIAGLFMALAKLREVHTIVNQQRTDMITEIDRLKQTITDMRFDNRSRGF